MRHARRTLLRALLLTAAATLALASPAAAAGLQNAGFEAGLDHWTATKANNPNSYYGPTYGPGTTRPADCRVPDGVCVIGSDSFTTDSTSYEPSQSHTVEPAEGSKMLRLGGPFTSPGQPQTPESYRVEQTFVVDAAQTELDLAYNIFTWDSARYDELVFRVTLTDAEGDVLTERRYESFGDTGRLKTTGWRSASLDLTGYEGEQVTLRISSGGTRDSSFGFWSYIDLGTSLPESPVGRPEPGTPTTPDGKAVPVNEQYDPATGLWWLSMPPRAECISLAISVPIDPGGGTVSNVLLHLEAAPGRMTRPMADTPPNPPDGVWRGVLECIRTGQLFVEYTLTEGGDSQTFVVPIGGLTLIDPQGVVHDKAAYDAARAGGATEAAALAAAALSGATVRLQREAGGEFVNVLSGDPGIMPRINPQVTGANGLFQWDVSPGSYRVVVSKPGYVTVTSATRDIPPPVLDLHIPMVRVSQGGGPEAGVATRRPSTPVCRRCSATRHRSCRP